MNLTIDLKNTSKEKVKALTNLLKNLDFATITVITESNEEALNAVACILELQDSLADMGFKPSQNLTVKV